jgi:hypothetical protein
MSNYYTLLGKIDPPKITVDEIVWYQPDGYTLYVGIPKFDLREWVRNLIQVRFTDVIFLKSCSKDVILPHIDDGNRQAALNVPLCGNFAKSGCEWWENGKSVACMISDEAALLNVANMHNPFNFSGEDRVVASISFTPPWTYHELRDLHLQGKLLKNNK